MNKKMCKIWSLFICLVVFCSSFDITIFANSQSGGVDGIEARYSTTLTDDGYIGIPVDIYTYYDTEGENVPTAESPIMLYVMNTNTERIGTDSDKEIVQSLIERGYVVVALDYHNHVKSVSPDLDWSIQGIRTEISKGTYLNGVTCKLEYTYVLPAGYNIVYNETYWSFDKHGAVGTLETIVERWNTDFQINHGSKTITFLDGTTKTVSEYDVEDIYDCVQMDGTPINLDLAMDIIYPTNPENEVPVMVCLSSSETRVGTWTNSKRPHLTGFLFDGYAGVITDYAYVPMARNDHYGYYDGNGGAGNPYISGDNKSYSLAEYNGVKSDSAAMRKIRSMADVTADGAKDFFGNDVRKFKFDVDKIGVYGNSKAGLCTRLGNPNFEELPEYRYFEGHYGETRLEAINNDGYDDPYIDDSQNIDVNGNKIVDDPEEQPYLTYADGSEIPSNANLVYSNCGGGTETIVSGNAPMYATGTTEKNGSYPDYYGQILSDCKNADVPLFALVNPGVGHSFGYGMDRDYGIDVYNSFRIFSNYWLKDEAAVCEYIDVEGETNVDVTSPIKIQFTGPISEEEITKVKVTNNATGKVVDGTWESAYGRLQWVFTPHTMTGGFEYTITVPADLKAENGKNIAEPMSKSFRTEYEQLDAATVLSENHTVSTENGMYMVFDDNDYSDSTTIDLRFSVTNDAANIVEIYPITSLNENDYTASVLGDKLGEIQLLGAGEYEYDVTDYVKNCSGKPAFFLKTTKEAGEVTLLNYNFESGKVDSGLSVASRVYTTVSDEKNDENNKENQSAKINYVVRQSSWINENNDIEGKFVPNLSEFCSFYLQKDSYTVNDLGRKFKLSFDVYDTTTRLIRVRQLSATTTDYVDENIMNSNFYTKENEWQTFDFEYRIQDEEEIAKNKRKIMLSHEVKSVAVLDPYAAVAVSGFAASKGLNEKYTLYNNVVEALQDNKVTSVNEKYTFPMYYDNIVLKEIITNVEIGTTATSSSIKPSLVLHPAEKHTLTVTDATHVENGDNGDASFNNSEELIVGGSSLLPDSGSKKTYIKLSLNDYSVGDTADFVFSVNEGSTGNIEIYGIEDRELAENWSQDTINPLNAPANDRLSGGVNASQVYNNAAISSVKIEQAGKYSVDITDYADYMKKQGAAYITLVLINTVEDTAFKQFEDFEGSDIMATYQGGNPIAKQKSDDYDHTDGTGYSYKFGADNTYDRIKYCFIEDYKEFTQDDLGRQFEVTFWAYMPGEKGQTGSFQIGEIAQRTSTVANSEILELELGTWTKFTREITLSEYTQWANNTSAPTWTESGIQAWIDIERLNNGSDASAENPVYLYVDDITIREVGMGSASLTVLNADETQERIVNSISFDGWTAGTQVLAGGFKHPTDGVYTIDNDVNRNEQNGSSAKFQPLHKYDRIYWTKLFDPINDTWVNEDVGRTFKVEFWAKSNVAGTFNYGLKSYYTRTAKGVGNYYVKDLDNPDQVNYSDSNFYRGDSTETFKGYEATFSADELNRWKKFSFEFTVDETMLPKTVYKSSDNTSVGQQAINRLGIRFTGFDVSKSPIVYIDDLLITEVCQPEAGNTLPFVDRASICESEATNTDISNLEVTKNEGDSTGTIYKTYLSFESTIDLAKTHTALLHLSVSEANGQTLKVYGITGETELPTNLTYNNAADLGEIYGGKELGTVDLSVAGPYCLDVTEYVKNNSPYTSIFAITSDDASGTTCAVLDFDSYSFSKDVDYKHYGTFAGEVKVENELAYVKGMTGQQQGITILNAFGNNAQVCDEGATYVISADVTPTGNAADYNIVLGLSDGSSVMADRSVTTTISKGAKQTITYRFVATAADVANGVSAITIYDDSADYAQELQIDNIVVKTDTAVRISEENCRLVLEIAAEHKCDYTKVYDAEGHWTECDCGYKTETIKHTMTEQHDAEGHWTECDCGHKTETIKHMMTEQHDTEGHWTECDCGYKTETIKHMMTEQHDTEGHWTECDCGYKTETIKHVLTEQHDAEGHWTECDCGHKTETIKHMLTEQHDAEGHWTECDCGYKTETIKHVLTEQHDAEGHWTECDCGHKTETIKHMLTEQHDAEGHWTECDCGYKTDKVKNELDSESKLDSESEFEPEPQSPETGDNSNIIIWFSLVVVFAFGMIAVEKKRKMR